MFGSTRWNPIDDVFNFQREVDRIFNQFWNELPARNAGRTMTPGQLQVSNTDDEWRIDVPMPGIDPEHVAIEVAGNVLSIRVEEKDANNKDVRATRYEQTLTIPPFLDIDKLTASHHHGMLRLALPIKESVKPRRIRIESPSGKKELTREVRGEQKEGKGQRELTTA